MELSHYVYESGNELFNLVTLKRLPIGASEDILREHFFLKGQERDAVNQKLFGQKQYRIGIKVIPTWECNLRCQHCFVLSKLVKRDDNPKLDPQKFTQFLQSIIEAQPTLKQIGLSFIGGEAALRAKDCHEILDAVEKHFDGSGIRINSTLTTNGTLLDVDVLKLIDRITLTTISLDGLEHDHNTQRKAFDPSLKGKNVFLITLRNIKRLILLGLRNKIRVQAALNDASYTDEKIEEFYRTLLEAGVRRDLIFAGCTVPTKTNGGTLSGLWQDYMSNKIYKYPCCKYRQGTEIVVDSNGKVYCDYFMDNSESPLGDIASSFGEIRAKHKQLILDTMPVLNDPKCQSCPVLGACWGRCCNIEHLRPSDHCNPTALKNEVERQAREGTLIGLFENIITNVEKHDI